MLSKAHALGKRRGGRDPLKPGFEPKVSSKEPMLVTVASKVGGMVPLNRFWLSRKVNWPPGLSIPYGKRVSGREPVISQSANEKRATLKSSPASG